MRRRAGGRERKRGEGGGQIDKQQVSEQMEGQS